MMFKKPKEGIGLEIGDGLIKAMHIHSSPKENRLLGFAMVEVNFREGRQGIVNAMQEVLKKLSVRKKKDKVNISVSGESVMVRDIHWPQMSDEEIRKALKFEVERQVHYKSEEIVFDYYSVLDRSIAETKTRVILVAAKKDLIDNYSSLIDSAGFHCGFVEVDTFSLLNCFYVNGPTLPPEKTIAIINVGMEVTNIDIIKGKIVGLTKDAFVAWGNLLDALPDTVEFDFHNVRALKGLMGSDDVYELSLFIMNALSNQIRRTIEFYESQGRDTVEEIFLSGKLAMYKNLDKYLQTILGLKVTIWDPISNIKHSLDAAAEKELKKNSLMLALCTGLACHRSFQIDLSGTKAAVRQNKFLKVAAQYKVLIYTAAITIFFMVGLWIILMSQVRIKDAHKQKLLQENQKLETILRDIEKLKEGREVLSGHMIIAKTLLSRRIQWSKKLYEISMSVPENLWLTEIYIQDLDKETVSDNSQFDRLIELGWEQKTPPDALAKQAQQILVIKGIAYSEASDRMLSIINSFIGRLKSNKDFYNDFQKIELKKSYREMVGDSAVMKYVIECLLK